jgi:hypothetical protein
MVPIPCVGGADMIDERGWLRLENSAKISSKDMSDEACGGSTNPSLS